MVEHNRAIRSDMSAGFAGLRIDLQNHEQEDRVVERRVHDLEQREDSRDKTITKRNLFGSGIVSAVIAAAIGWIFRTFGGH